MTAVTAVAPLSTTEQSPATDRVGQGTSATDAPSATPPVKPAAKKASGKKAKTLELTVSVTGTADGDWRAEIKHGSTYVVRNLAVAAAAVSRAARELHEELFTPIEALIDEARAAQAARVAALEADLEAARKALADLD